MSELSDRLVLLLMAATGLAVGIGWAAGYVEAEIPWWEQNEWLVLLGLLAVAILVGIWLSFNVISTR